MSSIYDCFDIMPYTDKRSPTVSESKSDDIFYIKTSMQFMSDKLDDLYQLKPVIQPILKLVTKLQISS